MTFGVLRRPPMRLLAWLLLPLSVAVGVFLLIRFYEMPRVENASPLAIALIVILSVLLILCLVAAPYCILAGTDWNRSLGHLYLVVTASLAANYSTPLKAGIPLRVYLYKRFMGIGPATGSALVGLEILLGTLVPAVISILVLVLLLPEGEMALPVLVAAGAAMAVGAIAFVRSRSYDRVAARLPLPGIARRLLAPGGGFVTAVRGVPLSSLATAAGVYAAMFVFVGVRSFYAFELFGGSMNVLELVGISAAAFTLGTVSFLPMGLGVRDATLVALFVQAGADRDVAIAVAALDRLLSTAVPFFLGILSAQILGLRAFGQPKDFSSQPESELVRRARRLGLLEDHEGRVGEPRPEQPAAHVLEGIGDSNH
ncbi:MAG: flippase-like domain-containing protein [Dehalococcoidia bacterium]|nr:flippase-like domain-containing protein [Dehalococcoidia bacterium]